MQINVHIEADNSHSVQGCVPEFNDSNKLQNGILPNLANYKKKKNFFK